MQVEVKRVDPLSDIGSALFDKVTQEQIERYGRDGGLSLQELAGSKNVFLVAFLDERPVGCGAVVPLDVETGELSRIFVDATARRNGVGTAIMQSLEAEGRKNYKRLVLETGTAQSESIGLYLRCGYSLIPCWGKSAGNPLSRCFEKFVRGADED